MSEADVISSSVELFRARDGAPLRGLTIDGDPWFVTADALALLDLNRSSIAGLDDDEKGVHSLDTPGGAQQVSIISESGLYSLILRSRKPEAKVIKRWITHEVLPAIRRTGAYATAPALTDDEIVHQALAISARRVETLTARVAELEPKAEVADKLLDADGDLSVRDAAQSLTRAGIKVGERRLFGSLEKLQKWIGRSGDGRYRVYQSAIDAGYMSVLPQSHYHPRTGVLVIDPPQPRVTPKGLQRLLSDYNHGGEA
nr:phage antirepressor KilAC domain-containing protein [Mycobacterium eburneum]